MKGSLHLATVSGIPVKIHWTFGLLILWVVFETSQEGFRLWMILISLFFVLSVFFCVILHEFGHALAARRYGVKTFDILMTPIGGIARLERMPEGRGEEFWVAIAGPVVNFLIVGLIWLGFLLVQSRALPIHTLDFWRFGDEFSYFKMLMLANGYLGVFNLLPAFPMDGGRMLRSLLSLRMSRSQATQIASYVGQFIAVGMFGLGLMRGQPTLALIGVFIFFAARQEYQALLRQVKIINTKASEIMDPIQHVLFMGHEITDAKRIAEASKEAGFVVWSRPGIPAGYITRENILKHQPADGLDGTINPWIVPSPVAVAPDLPAMQVAKLMQQHKIPVVLVYDQFYYLGQISWNKMSAML